MSGGIAAYKTVSLVRLLTRAGHDVTVIPTQSALQFVGAPTWEAISHRPIASEVFERVDQVQHVALGQEADLIVIAPATAHTIARLAHGFADDLLGTTVLASRAPVLVAPAMHTEMWEHPATQANIMQLRERGVEFVGPELGALTGADVGVGRMTEPEEIFARIVQRLGGRGRDLDGMRILVSAGGTLEPIDPVRFIGNRSSGKQGLAIARAAVERGAHVTIVLANVTESVPDGVNVERVQTVAELEGQMRKLAEHADVIVMAAAVADYSPVNPSGEKLRKSDGRALELELVETTDVLRALVDARPAGQIVVGFAAETGTSAEAVLDIAREKLRRKGCDVLVVNQVGPDHDGVERVFGRDDTDVHVLLADASAESHVQGSKLAVAHHILDAVVDLHTRNEHSHP